MWNGTMFVDLDWPLNASSLLSASAGLLVFRYLTRRRKHTTVTVDRR